MPPACFLNAPTPLPLNFTPEYRMRSPCGGVTSGRRVQRVNFYRCNASAAAAQNESQYVIRNEINRVL